MKTKKNPLFLSCLCFGFVCLLADAALAGALDPIAAEGYSSPKVFHLEEAQVIKHIQHDKIAKGKGSSEEKAFEDAMNKLNAQVPQDGSVASVQIISKTCTKESDTFGPGALLTNHWVCRLHYSYVLEPEGRTRPTPTSGGRKKIGPPPVVMEKQEKTFTQTQINLESQLGNLEKQAREQAAEQKRQMEEEHNRLRAQIEDQTAMRAGATRADKEPRYWEVIYSQKFLNENTKLRRAVPQVHRLPRKENRQFGTKDAAERFLQNSYREIETAKGSVYKGRFSNWRELGQASPVY